MPGIPVELTGPTVSEDRFVPARTLPLFLAFVAIGAAVLLFTLRTVNARTVEELQAHVIAIQKLDGKPWTATAKDDTLVFGSITFEIR
jgi:hypothetical protein